MIKYMFPTISQYKLRAILISKQYVKLEYCNIRTYRCMWIFAKFKYLHEYV